MQDKQLDIEEYQILLQEPKFKLLVNSTQILQQQQSEIKHWFQQESLYQPKNHLIS